MTTQTVSQPHVSNNPSSKRFALFLEPLDVLFFRDSRPFTASYRSVSTLPSPQTIAGALRTAVMRALNIRFDLPEPADSFERLVTSVCPEYAQSLLNLTCHGPWLARRQNEDIALLFPMPRNIVVTSTPTRTVLVLKPLMHPPQDSWTITVEDIQLKPLWAHTPDGFKPADGFLTADGMMAYLNGEIPSCESLVSPAHLLAHDQRTGIKISPQTLTAEESQIYARGFLALKPNIGFYVEIDWPVGLPPLEHILPQLSPLPVGGENKRVVVHLQRHPFPWRTPSIHSNSNVFIVMTTPCVFYRHRWRPDCINKEQIISAAVGPPQAVSGWNMQRRCPKPTRFAVPAGSVYFLKGPAKDTPLCLAETMEDQLTGWGRYMKGVWNHD